MKEILVPNTNQEETLNGRNGVRKVHTRESFQKISQPDLSSISLTSYSSM